MTPVDPLNRPLFLGDNYRGWYRRVTLATGSLVRLNN